MQTKLDDMDLTWYFKKYHLRWRKIKIILDKIVKYKALKNMQNNISR